MLPTLRLLIAAMLATVVVLICGFGIFAAFRVSRDPIAHLPAAAAPLQMVADAGAPSVALPAADDGAPERPQFEVPIVAPQDAAPATLTIEKHVATELAEDEPPTTPGPRAAKQAEASADHEPDREPVASASSEQDAAHPSREQLALPYSGGRADMAANAAADLLLPRPPAPEAEPSFAVIEVPTDNVTATLAPPQDAPDDQPTFAQMPSGRLIAALNPLAEPVADSQPAVKPAPEDATNRDRIETPSKPPLAPSLRRSLGRAAPAITRVEPPRRVEQPARTLSAASTAKAKRARVAVARPVRTVRSPTVYDGQYAQSSDQSYGYGQGDAAPDPQQATARYVVRHRPAPPVRRTNSGLGGPFVRAGGH